MRIHVGSMNQVKVNAVKDVLAGYPIFAECEVSGVDAPSGVSDQPKSLEETVQGAMNRAKAAFDGCQIGIGLESGLMSVPFSKSGYMDVCACAIYDGQEFHLGLSSAWESPKHVTDLMTKEGLDMNQAYFKAGLSTDPKLGAGQGAVGIMTKGRVTRKTYTEQAIVMALIHLEHKHLVP